ncbi:MAG: hypothetical protein ABWX68_07180 [Arthrobacter sp.]|uniref:hypothetical protein n=1 Tax=Arthrobacter sp. TaxID=1667 RepID=UPI00346A4E36
MYLQNSPDLIEGQKAAQASLILGIVGIFILGIVLGPLAIVKAKSAERRNVPATAGKVLGWIATIFGILGLIWFIFVVIALMSVGTTAP